jgi:dihydrofolate reductase
MGRKTYESIGKPLPNRRNIIISSTMKNNPPAGTELFANLETAIAKLIEDDAPEVLIIGGARLFEAFLQNLELNKGTDRIYLTRVHAKVEGDVFLPKIDWSKWKEIKEPVTHVKDEKHAFSFTYHVFERV